MAVPNPAVGQLVKFTQSFYARNQLFQNSFAYRVSNVVGGGISVAQMAQGWQTSIEANIPFFLSNEVLLAGTRCEVFALTSKRVVQSSFYRGVGAAGAALPTIVASQAALVVGKATGFAGAGARGRIFWGPLNKGDLIADGEIDPAFEAALVAELNLHYLSFTFTYGITSAAFIAVLLKKGALALPWIATDLTEYIQTGRIGTIKKRGDYGRTNPRP